MDAERWASRTYKWAAVYGIVVLALAYVQPVPDPYHLTYLGFVGVALVFQGVFLVIARDPRRFMPMMPVTLFEKLCYGIPALGFFVRGQARPMDAVFGAIDCLLALLFFVAWRRLAATTA